MHKYEQATVKPWKSQHVAGLAFESVAFVNGQRTKDRDRYITDESKPKGGWMMDDGELRYLAPGTTTMYSICNAADITPT